jgi:hypothetical protein
LLDLHLHGLSTISKLHGSDCLLQAAEAFLANNETLGNALEKLSEELYSSDVHFVLELVQVGTGSQAGSIISATYQTTPAANPEVLLPVLLWHRNSSFK